MEANVLNDVVLGRWLCACVCFLIRWGFCVYNDSQALKKTSCELKPFISLIYHLYPQPNLFPYIIHKILQICELKYKVQNFGTIL